MKGQQTVLIKITTFHDDQNGNATKFFSSSLIKKFKSILKGLPYVPEIHPVKSNCICFEFYLSKGDSLELEICEDKTKYFKVQKARSGEWEDGEILKDEINQITSLINTFFGKEIS